MPLRPYTFALVSLLAIPMAIPALAGSPLQDALAKGATALTSTQIAELLVDKTVKASTGQKTFLFHYSADNLLTGKLVDGAWSGSGYYGITDDNLICVSMKKDKGRLRCMTVVKQGNSVSKYDVTGKRTFELLDIQDGNRL